MSIEVNDAAFAAQIQALSAASVVDSELGNRLREVIFEELKAARNRIAASIKFKNGDPRGTANSVKRYVARKYLGGVVSIASGAPTGRCNSYEAPRKVQSGKRGGNRMVRSQRTDDILHTADRDFILRFVNNGTNPRYANGRNGRWTNRGNKTFEKLQEQGDYYRGAISPRNFFGTSGRRELKRAIDNLKKIIDQEFEKVFR